MKSVELIIFSLPLATYLASAIRRIFLGQRSTEKHIQSINRYGLKKHLIRLMFLNPTLYCYLAAPFFIPFGWAWAIFAFILVGGLSIYLMYGKPMNSYPALNAAQFNALKTKQRNNLLIGIPIYGLWYLSWF